MIQHFMHQLLNPDEFKYVPFVRYDITGGLILFKRHISDLIRYLLNNIIRNASWNERYVIVLYYINTQCRYVTTTTTKLFELYNNTRRQQNYNDESFVWKVSLIKFKIILITIKIKCHIQGVPIDNFFADEKQ